jgi:hypothetical protein
MTELTEEPEPPGGSLAVLRAELDGLRRRVTLSDEEIDLLQVEAAASKHRWYRERQVPLETLCFLVSNSAGALIDKLAPQQLDQYRCANYGRPRGAGWSRRVTGRQPAEPAG